MNIAPVWELWRLDEGMGRSSRIAMFETEELAHAAKTTLSAPYLIEVRQGYRPLVFSSIDEWNGRESIERMRVLASKLTPAEMAMAMSPDFQKMYSS
jgi:hypothetical protein